MTKRAPFRVCMALALALLLLLAAGTPALAATSSEIKTEINELNGEKSQIQGRIDSIQEEIDSLDYEKANTLEKKLVLDRKNELAQQELDVIQEQISIVDGLIANIQEDLAAAREEEQRQKKAWLARVRAMEESADADYMQVLFDATSFSDLLTRLDLMGEVMAYDETLEADYVAARENVETLEAQAEEMFAENEARRTELETKQAQLQTDIEAACQLIASMDENTEEYEQMKAQDAETISQLEALIAEKWSEYQKAYAAEEAERLAQLAAQQQQQQQQQQQLSGGSAPQSAPQGTVSGAGFMWPSYTKTLTDKYGPRPKHPVTGKSTFHDGVDVGASYGTQIWAAAAGTVILAGRNGGYGNCVMVMHANGYTTLYGHMSSISVSVGQTVAQGQVLGLVGATGQVTGPHLHFEIRLNNSTKTVDPMSFQYY